MADRQIQAVLGGEAGRTHAEVFAEEGKKGGAWFDSQMTLGRWQKHSDVWNAKAQSLHHNLSADYSMGDQRAFVDDRDMLKGRVGNER